MRKPKPSLSIYLKTRFKHPLKLSYDLIYSDDLGNRYEENFNAHTAIINLTAIGLSLVTLIRLNCTIWYFLLWVLIFFVLRYLRYLWADFSMLDENNKPSEKTETMSIWQRIFLVLEVISMISIVTGVTILSNASPYARAANYLSQPIIDREIETGKTYKHEIDQKADSLLQAYEASLDLAKTGSPNAVITDYRVALLPEGTVYLFIFKNESPSAFLKLTDEFEICRVSTNLVYEDFLSYSYLKYDSAFAHFNPVDPPATEIDTQKIINILWTNAGFNQEDVEGIYIGTHFFTDLPELSDPGGNTWAVQVEIDDKLFYYTVDLAEGTAVLEKTAKTENE